MIPCAADEKRSVNESDRSAAAHVASDAEAAIDECKRSTSRDRFRFTVGFG